MGARNLSPPGGGSRRPWALTHRPSRVSFVDERGKGRHQWPNRRRTISDADLDLLLREADRDDPILSAPRTEDSEPRESFDSQILAGLVSP